MGAALCQRQDPGLGERRLLALVDPGAPEVLGVGRGVGDVETGPVDRDQPATGQPHPRCPGRTDRAGHPLKQRRQRRGPQPCPRLEDRRLRRRAISFAPPRRPGQTVGQLRQHIGIGAFRAQRHPDREIRHHPSRQRPMTHLRPTGLGNHLIDQPRRKHPGQHPHRHQIRQPTIRLRLHPPSTRHTTKLHRCKLN